MSVRLFRTRIKFPSTYFKIRISTYIPEIITNKSTSFLPYPFEELPHVSLDFVFVSPHEESHLAVFGSEKH